MGGWFRVSERVMVGRVRVNEKVMVGWARVIERGDRWMVTA